jgi:hypothetical protein
MSAAAATLEQLQKQVDALLISIRAVDGYDAKKEAAHVLV